MLCKQCGINEAIEGRSVCEDCLNKAIGRYLEDHPKDNPTEVVKLAHRPEPREKPAA